MIDNSGIQDAIDLAARIITAGGTEVERTLAAALVVASSRPNIATPSDVLELQLPKPAAYRGRQTWPEGQWKYDTDEHVQLYTEEGTYEREALYTEQQVRDLLKRHGTSPERTSGEDS